MTNMMIWASQVAPGHENGLKLRVYGTKGGIEWVQGDARTLANILLHGINGEISVAGTTYNGAMPAWKTRMHPNEVVLVAAYVATLRGKNLPGPRPAEGAAISPWNSAEAKSGQ